MSLEPVVSEEHVAGAEPAARLHVAVAGSAGEHVALADSVAPGTCRSSGVCRRTCRSGGFGGPGTCRISRVYRGNMSLEPVVSERNMSLERKPTGQLHVALAASAGEHVALADSVAPAHVALAASCRGTCRSGGFRGPRPHVAVAGSAGEHVALAEPAGQLHVALGRVCRGTCRWSRSSARNMSLERSRRPSYMSQ